MNLTVSVCEDLLLEAGQSAAVVRQVPSVTSQWKILNSSEWVLSSDSWQPNQTKTWGKLHMNTMNYTSKMSQLARSCTHRAAREKKMRDMVSATLDELRLQRKLCDVVIKVGHVEFNAHKVILCSCSLYFRWVDLHRWAETNLKLFKQVGRKHLFHSGMPWGQWYSSWMFDLDCTDVFKFTCCNCNCFFLKKFFYVALIIGSSNFISLGTQVKPNAVLR